MKWLHLPFARPLRSLRNGRKPPGPPRKAVGHNAHAEPILCGTWRAPLRSHHPATSGQIPVVSGQLVAKSWSTMCRFAAIRKTAWPLSCQICAAQWSTGAGHGPIHGQAMVICVRRLPTIWRNHGQALAKFLSMGGALRTASGQQKWSTSDHYVVANTVQIGLRHVALVKHIQ